MKRLISVFICMTMLLVGCGDEGNQNQEYAVDLQEEIGQDDVTEDSSYHITLSDIQDAEQFCSQQILEQNMQKGHWAPVIQDHEIPGDLQRRMINMNVEQDISYLEDYIVDIPVVVREDIAADVTPYIDGEISANMLEVDIDGDGEKEYLANVNNTGTKEDSGKFKIIIKEIEDHWLIIARDVKNNGKLFNGFICYEDKYYWVSDCIINILDPDAEAYGIDYYTGDYAGSPGWHEFEINLTPEKAFSVAKLEESDISFEEDVEDIMYDYRDNKQTGKSNYLTCFDFEKNGTDYMCVLVDREDGKLINSEDQVVLITAKDDKDTWKAVASYQIVSSGIIYLNDLGYDAYHLELRNMIPLSDELKQKIQSADPRGGNWVIQEKIILPDELERLYMKTYLENDISYLKDYIVETPLVTQVDIQKQIEERYHFNEEYDTPFPDTMRQIDIDQDGMDEYLANYMWHRFIIKQIDNEWVTVADCGSRYIAKPDCIIEYEGKIYWICGNYISSLESGTQEYDSDYFTDGNAGWFLQSSHIDLQPKEYTLKTIHKEKDVPFEDVFPEYIDEEFMNSFESSEEGIYGFGKEWSLESEAQMDSWTAKEVLIDNHLYIVAIEDLYHYIWTDTGEENSLTSDKIVFFYEYAGDGQYKVVAVYQLVADGVAILTAS